MNTRRGAAGAMALLAVGLAMTSAAAIGVELAARRHARMAHQLQLQGREYALGARALPPGTIACGDWRISIAEDHAVAASHGAGTWRISADGTESWRHGNSP